MTDPEVSQPVAPPPMTEAQFRQAIKEFIDAYHTASMAEVDEKIATAVAAVSENTIKLGDKVALQAEQGMFLCAEEGGPTDEEEDFVLTSRREPGPWESWTLLKGV